MLNIVSASMPKRLLLAAALCGFCSMAHAQRAPSRVGIVFVERLWTESKTGKAADAKLEGEFFKRDKALREQIAHFKAMSDKFDGEAPTMSESDRIRRARELLDMENDVKRAQREFREDLIQRKNEERDIIGKKAKTIIEQIAEQDQLDIVVQDAAWFNPRIDLTDRVIKALDK